MTPEQINREIAERVIQAVEGDPGTAPAFQVFPSGKVVLTLTARPYNWFEFDPCHRIDHAWMVVEKLMSMKWYLKIEIAGDMGNLVWWCDLVNPDGRYVQQKADTAPMAICLAALEAVPPAKSR